MSLFTVYFQSTTSLGSSVLQAEDRGEVQIPIENYLSDRFTEKRAGSYAVYGKDSCLQYIGFARSVVSALKVRHHAHCCHSCCIAIIEMRML